MTVQNQLPARGFNPLTPEYLVFDLAQSLRFWSEGLGFGVAYKRPEEGFAYLERPEGAQVMLSRINPKWVAASLEYPLGRGMHIEIGVEHLAPILAALDTLGSPLFHRPHEAWHRAGECELGSLQFTAQDPNGYLIRCSQSLGARPVNTET